MVGKYKFNFPGEHDAKHIYIPAYLFIFQICKKGKLLNKLKTFTKLTLIDIKL